MTIEVDLWSPVTHMHTHMYTCPYTQVHTNTHIHRVYPSYFFFLHLLLTYINYTKLAFHCDIFFLLFLLWYIHMCIWYSLTMSALQYFYCTPSTPSASLKVSFLLSCLFLNLDCSYEKRKCGTCVSRVWLISKTKFHLHPFSYDGIIPFLFMTE